MGAEHVASLAERMRHEVEALCIEHTGSKIGERVTISAGVASAVPDPNASAEELVSQADEALYERKRQEGIGSSGLPGRKQPIPISSSQMVSISRQLRTYAIVEV
jgi:GGDEF domain-containing protein